MVKKTLVVCSLILIINLILIGCANDSGTTNLLKLTESEKKIYDKFSKNYNDTVLKGLGPLTICKLYLYAEELRDYETEYELYIQDEKYLGWSKEEHLKEHENEKDEGKIEGTKDEYLGIFRNAVNVQVSYLKDNKKAVITFKNNFVTSKDIEDEDFVFTFSLAKNKNGIWKVCFLPMQ